MRRGEREKAKVLDLGFWLAVDGGTCESDADHEQEDGEFHRIELQWAEKKERNDRWSLKHIVFLIITGESHCTVSLPSELIIKVWRFLSSSLNTSVCSAHVSTDILTIKKSKQYFFAPQWDCLCAVQQSIIFPKSGHSCAVMHPSSPLVKRILRPIGYWLSKEFPLYPLLFFKLHRTTLTWMTPRFKSRRRRRRRTAASCATWSSSGQSLQPFSLSRLCLRFSWLWTSSKPLWATESSLSCLQLLRLVLYCNCILCTLFVYPRGSSRTNCVFSSLFPLSFCFVLFRIRRTSEENTNKQILSHTCFIQFSECSQRIFSFLLWPWIWSNSLPPFRLCYLTAEEWNPHSSLTIPQRSIPNSCWTSRSSSTQSSASSSSPRWASLSYCSCPWYKAALSCPLVSSQVVLFTKQKNAIEK